MNLEGWSEPPTSTTWNLQEAPCTSRVPRCPSEHSSFSEPPWAPCPSQQHRQPHPPTWAYPVSNVSLNAAQPRFSLPTCPSPINSPAQTSLTSLRLTVLLHTSPGRPSKGQSFSPDSLQRHRIQVPFQPLRSFLFFSCSCYWAFSSLWPLSISLSSPSSLTLGPWHTVSPLPGIPFSALGPVGKCKGCKGKLDCQGVQGWKWAQCHGRRFTTAAGEALSWSWGGASSTGWESWLRNHSGPSSPGLWLYVPAS